jgi:hypothetical protein
MAEYLVLIYDDAAELAQATPTAIEEELRRHEEFAGNNRAALRGGAQLAGGETATSIRRGADGTSTVTDGTFAETKEVLGGFYRIEAEDLDAALEIAKQVPAGFGGVEVRPVVTG